MVMLCERCCNPIGDHESMVRYAHIDRAHDDGSITWVHTYVHTRGDCLAPRPAVHERPDQGGWDASRGIGAHRT
jgi:hypothetical protein